MDTARQVVRWSIPGWVFLFMLSVFQTITWLIEGRSARGIMESGAPLLTPAAIAAVVTAGVPLGFILYQIYYSWYGKVLLFGFVNRDRGAAILLALSSARRDSLCTAYGGTPDLEEMDERVRPFLFPYPFRRLKGEFRNKSGRERFEAKVHANWELIRFLLARLCILNKADVLRGEIVTLADIYHGIGAARAALLLACMLHLIVNVVVASTISVPVWRLGLAVLSPYLFALWLFRVFEYTRNSALRSHLSMLIFTLRTLSLTPVREPETT